MKKKTFIARADGQFIKEITGYSFDWKGIELVVHRNINLGSLDLWTVSEPISGMRISSTNGNNKYFPALVRSREEAIERAAEVLDSFPEASIRNTIQNELIKVNKQGERK